MLVDPIAITLLEIDAFDKLNVPYLIGGLLASALNGTARSTLDSDLVADVKTEQVIQLVKMLEKEFYINETMILDAIQHQNSFNVVDLLQRALKESE
jgi:hypothetical protein